MLTYNAMKPRDAEADPKALVGCALINKDHQRMMVDPMFMIVQSLRSFLTAVTPTAVYQ